MTAPSNPSDPPTPSSASAPPTPFDVAAARAAFPSLGGEWVYLDNAGGSQCLGAAAERARDYLLSTNVQLGATYRPSVAAGERVADATAALADWIGAESVGEVVVGPSTTQNMVNLAASFGRWLSEGDEIVVTNADHEANVSPWRRLEERGIRIREWEVDEATWELDVAGLERVLSDRTRLVCFTAASNVVGSLTPVTELVGRIHSAGALACVDAVAQAPHRRPDAGAWGADIVGFSLYKAFGPHAAMLRVREGLLRELPSLNHAYMGEDAGPAKLQPGNVNYELTWAAGAVVDYLEELAASAGRGGGTRRDRIAAAYEAITVQEEILAARLLGFLASRERVRILGRAEPDASLRVPTVSFTVEGRSSRSIIEHLDALRLGARHGHFSAPRLVERMGLAPADGVVRISMVHVNTTDEIDRLCEALAEVT